MNANQKAKIIKSLSSKDRFEREAIENRYGPIGPFYSGLISYSDHPVYDARLAYESFLGGWEHALKNPWAGMNEREARNHVKHAKEMIRLLNE